MSGVAETYIVVSLLMAVFAAVAAVGTSLVLGVGFERLRNGFEIVRKQTAFFSDAIRQLDDQTDNLDRRTGDLERQSHVMEIRASALEVHQNELSREIREQSEKIAESPAAQPKPEMHIQQQSVANDMLTKVAGMASRAKAQHSRLMERSQAHAQPFYVPESMLHHVMDEAKDQQIRFH